MTLRRPGNLAADDSPDDDERRTNGKDRHRPACATSMM
jgi:hypothetical protein